MRISKKRASFLVALSLVIVLAAAIVLLGIKNRPVFPLKSEEILQIGFGIYPQDIPNYTITDRNRIDEIVNTLNELERENAGSRRLDQMSGPYYSFRLYGDQSTWWINMDKNILEIVDAKGKNWSYATDNSNLCDILEQTYYDRMSGVID